MECVGFSGLSSEMCLKLRLYSYTDRFGSYRSLVMESSGVSAPSPGQGLEWQPQTAVETPCGGVLGKILFPGIRLVFHAQPLHSAIAENVGGLVPLNKDYSS